MNNPVLDVALQEEALGTKSDRNIAVPLEKPDVSTTIIDALDNDENVIDLDENEPEHPLNWPLWRKWSIVSCTALMFMLVNLGTITIVPAVPKVMEEFHVTNELYSTLLVSIWELGEVFGPFLVGSLSELYGRMPVYHTGNILFILCLTGGALSTNMSMLIAFRFLCGLVVSSVTLGPSIVGDLFRKGDRGTAMSLAIAFPLLGPFAGPVIGSYITQAKGWRWSIWIVVIAVGAVTCFGFLTFRETYKVKLVQRKVERLRKSTGNEHLRSKYESSGKHADLKDSLLRPIKMLFLSPIVFIISFFTALVYGISYVILTTLTPILEDNYGLGQGPVGLAFLGRAAGNVIAMLLYAMVSDRYIKYKKSQEGHLKPEHRLPLMLLGAIVLPIGLFLYGWSAEKHVHWIIPIIGTASVGFSFILSILPTENYLVDVHELHAASAVAVCCILRALFAAILPLVGPPLYNRLGLGWATALLQYMSFTIPSSTQSPSSTNPTCTLAATFPFFESQYLGWSLSSPTPPTLDISIVSPLSNSPFNTPPTWTSAFFPENSDTPQHFGVLTPVLRLDTTVNSLPCSENGVLSFVFRFADGVVGNKTVYEIWPQYPAGLSSGLPMTGVYLSVC